MFDYHLLGGLPSRYLGSMINEVLVAVPLFIFMGLILERSGIAEMLLTTMGQLFGKLRGGLAYSVVVVGRCWRPRPASSARPSSPWG